jgi:hypothetical protein
MCENPRVNVDVPQAVAELMGDVAAAVARRVAAVREDVYETILREIPQLRDDKPVLKLLAATLNMSRVVAGYIDQTSEEMVVAYGEARENWLRNRSAAGRADP